LCKRVFNPMVTVVIRSYNRIPSLIELINVCLTQNYSNYEIVVVEQSGEQFKEYKEQFKEFARDQRLRLFHYPPLGPIKARNEAIKHAKGEIIIFIDDDDIPLFDSWISGFVKNFKDPNCIGVTGRMVQDPDENSVDHDSRKNYSRCLSYSFFKTPASRVRHSKWKSGVDIVQGGNSALRKEYIDRVGGWDEGYTNHEENSMDFKLKRIMRRSQYFCYDPTPVALRRLDIAGGLDRRSYLIRRIFREEWVYYSKMVKKYFPLRFFLFFPVYLFIVLKRTWQYASHIDNTLTMWHFIRKIFGMNE